MPLLDTQATVKAHCRERAKVGSRAPWTMLGRVGRPVEAGSKLALAPRRRNWEKGVSVSGEK